MQFHPRLRIGNSTQAAPFVRCPKAQLRLGVISDSAKFTTHELSEERVDELQNCFATAKIFRERNRDAGSVAPGFGVALKDSRVGETEAIDALLHVANKKTIRFGAVAAQC